MHQSSTENAKVDFSAFPLWVKLLVAACFVSGGTDFVVAVNIQGDALGTSPTVGRFYVKSHGNETDVTRGVWMGSLAISYISSVLFTGMAWSVVLYFPRAMRGAMQKMVPTARHVFKLVVLVFLSVWTVLWLYATHRDLLVSLLAYSRIR